ncbi:MAG: biotin/lipoyl-binding protein [Synergistaceae bacterium]|jgi:multidrug efflux pump subunit AcrA (membrane-fusion protein)|nr:biotin/lipoyl-binding protein [Synergistaceae bacterium]
MKNDIFNQDALARLRSPEQLDTLLRITQPVAWMALLTLLFLAASIALWSVFGVISVTVRSVGMITDQAGVVNVYHDTGGKVAEVLIKPGDRISKGDIVATLSLPSMLNDIIKTRQNIARSSNQQQVENGVYDFDTLVNVWYASFNITSSFNGIVTEVKVNEGDVISPGSTSVCSIRLDESREDLVAVMYVPMESGKKVRSGMLAQLTPSGADAHEDGSLLGVVRSVSLYPASNAGVMRTIGNAEIVSWIAQKMGGPVMEVNIDLVRDPQSSSGYLWSSVVGNHPEITAGTACTGNIVTDRQPPLSKVFKKLSQWLRNL